MKILLPDLFLPYPGGGLSLVRRGGRFLPLNFKSLSNDGPRPYPGFAFWPIRIFKAVSLRHNQEIYKLGIYLLIVYSGFGLCFASPQACGFDGLWTTMTNHTGCSQLPTGHWTTLKGRLTHNSTGTATRRFF